MEERFEKHREFLVDRIEPDFGLLDKLLASGTLTKEDSHKIKLKDNTAEDRNRMLLDFVLKKKKAKELVSALGDIGQTHLVNYINSDGEFGHSFGDDWPLSKSDINRLDINRESLIDLLDTTDLCLRLFSEGIINKRQKQLIYSKPTDVEKSEALLDILAKFSLRQYKQTLVCLKLSNQSHIADFLIQGGAVVRFHANIEGAVGHVDELEDEIITKLTKVLEDRPLEEATRLLELTHLRIIAARKGQSIVIYIHCTTQEELQHLIDLLEADRMKRMIEMIFVEFLSIGGAVAVALTWSLEEFKRAAKYFGSEDSLSLPTDATDRHEAGKERVSRNLPKLVQMGLIKEKHAQDESKVTISKTQRSEDSGVVSFSDHLQSKLTFTDRSLFSSALAEESRYRDRDRMHLVQDSPRYTLIPVERLALVERSSDDDTRRSPALRKVKGLRRSSPMPDSSDELRFQSGGQPTENRPELLSQEQDKMRIKELEEDLLHERMKSSGLLDELSKLQEELDEQKRKFTELEEKLKKHGIN